jgi:type IV secretion system protein TrbG
MNRFPILAVLSTVAMIVPPASAFPIPAKPVPTSVKPGPMPSAVPARDGTRVSLRPARRVSRLRRRALPSASANVAAANRAATLEPTSHAYLNGVQVYPYAEGMLYHVYAAPERVTDIALQPGEALGAVASGDTVRWVIGDTSSGTGAEKRMHVLVKPFAMGLTTNLVITTDRRTYHITLASTAAAMAAISWIYPQDAMIALKHVEGQAQTALTVATGLELEKLHFDYALSGDHPAWRPLRAFDDGRQTFIEFPASLAVGEAPPLFLVDGHGVAQLVNYRVLSRFYIVDRLFDFAELRLGTKHQDVVRIARAAGPAGPRGRAS